MVVLRKTIFYFCLVYFNTLDGHLSNSELLVMARADHVTSMQRVGVVQHTPSYATRNLSLFIYQKKGDDFLVGNVLVVSSTTRDSQFMRTCPPPITNGLSCDHHESAGCRNRVEPLTITQHWQTFSIIPSIVVHAAWLIGFPVICFLVSWRFPVSLYIRYQKYHGWLLLGLFHYHNFQFSITFHCISNPFPTQTRIFYSTIWLCIDSSGWWRIDTDTTTLDRIKCVLYISIIIRVDACL